MRGRLNQGQRLSLGCEVVLNLPRGVFMEISSADAAPEYVECYLLAFSLLSRTSFAHGRQISLTYLFWPRSGWISNSLDPEITRAMVSCSLHLCCLSLA
jgi:hypothetical protein